MPSNNRVEPLLSKHILNVDEEMARGQESRRSRNSCKGETPLWNMRSHRPTSAGQSFLSTRTRDYIFTFLGLAMGVQNTAFDPDYDKELSSIVLRYTKEFVKVGHGPEILNEARIKNKRKILSFRPGFQTRLNRGVLFR